MLIYAILALASTSAAGPSPKADGTGTRDPQGPSAAVFPITFWAIHYWRYVPEWDYETLTSDEQYQLIKDCHFNLVMGGPLEKAERFGLSGMSDAVSRPEFRELWWTPDQPVTDEQRQKIVDAISAVDRNSPALWGYHLTDEPGPVLYAKVRAVRDLIKSVDPHRPVFVNLHPGSDAAKYIAEVAPDLCAYDHYPIFEDGYPLDGNIPPGFEHSNFLNDLARHRAACQEHGLWFLPTLLSCGHSYEYEVEGAKLRRDYGHVTEARLRWQAYSALAYHAGGIAWFIYFSSPSETYEEAAIGHDWKPTRIYDWLRQINQEVGAVGPILRGLRSVGVYESRPFYCWKGLGVEELSDFDPQGIITGVEGGLVSVGEFRDPADSTYLMIVNRNVNEAVELKLQLRWERVGTLTVFDRDRGAWAETPLWRTGQPDPRFPLAPGEGLFLRLTPP